jgi:hypothetical protein
VDQVVQEPGAGVDLDQHGCDRHPRQHPGQLLAERVGLGGDVLGGQRRDDQLPVFAQPHLARGVLDRPLTRPLDPGPAEQAVEVGQGGVQLLVGQGQRVSCGGGLADQLAEPLPQRRPPLGREQERRRVGVAARPGHVHVARPQPIPSSTHSSQ